jgi:hypothetical protein
MRALAWIAGAYLLCSAGCSIMLASTVAAEHPFWFMAIGLLWPFWLYLNIWSYDESP